MLYSLATVPFKHTIEMTSSDNNLQPLNATSDPRPLPEGWNQSTTLNTNQQFWVHAISNIKTYYDPAIRTLIVMGLRPFL
ncbi:MAG: hypothetical protein CL912_01005 [Deltaproteobacteria bacterium]|nr:hypothetical protein [Deltaproteobacteria bacterium]